MGKTVVYLLICCNIFLVILSAEPEPKVPTDLTMLEYAHDDPHAAHDENVHATMFIGSGKAREPFAHMKESEKKEKLEQIFKNIDANNDGFIDPPELKNWMLQSLRNIDIEGARITLQNDDMNGDNKVKWTEYLRKRHEMSVANLGRLKRRSRNDTDMLEYIRTIDDEKKTFDMADTNKDGFLDAAEYSAFESPWKYKHMAGLMVEDIFKASDKNRDKVVTFEEYMAYRKVTPEEKDRYDWVKRAFEKLDLNKDGKLTYDELLRAEEKKYPEEKRARTEAEHIMTEVDKNHDRLLSKKEVMNKYLLMLEKEHEVEKHKHDEL